ncbi:Formin, FH2 domain containing protein [Trema orientale]|uniref:Formin-like protein n=1 Tax=Trema orientale TaxID=63057 RepID=A0A2P5C4J4_TREOI|nr:Formin, FH2 domain containing protein [Trema orientale]
MGLIRRSCFIVLAILLCAWASRSSDEKKSTEQVLLRQLVDPASGEIDGNLAEEVWFNCKFDLIHLKEAVKVLELSLPEKIPSNFHGINPESWSLAKENIQKTVSFLHPQVKQALLDCMQEHNLLFRVSGEEAGSKIWYSKFLEFIFPRDYVPRRNLASESLQSVAGAPAPAPAVGSPIPSPGPAPSTSQLPGSTPPAPSPKQPFFPPINNDSNLGGPPAENSSSGPDSGSNVRADKKSKSHRSVVIAVAVTASVTFVIVALLFLCCSGFCGTGSKVRRNDERPLLSLSLSDFSIGSSPKSYAYGSSNKEEGHGHQSQNTKDSSLDGNFRMGSSVVRTSWNNTVSGASEFKTFDISTNTDAQPPLKPPPGRVSTTPMGMPPLKPPPGRADPLPPEPPSAFKPPSTKPGPPPPPPPVPPPSLKPLGSTGPPASRPSPPTPPLPPGTNAGPRPPPPPPPKSGVPPPRPPQLPMGPKLARPPPLAPKHPLNASFSEGADLNAEVDAPKAKLKPFFWDKVLANPDHSMVWHQIKSGSFQFDENMIETLFGYGATDKSKSEPKKESSSQDPSPQFVQIIDPKKSQNLAILLRALNVTIEEVCDALREGNELPSEFVQNLLKMAPTSEEELKLRMFNGELSQLGPAERFLKALVDIPFAFKRLEALLFMSTLQEEVTITKESFETLEVACKELRNSRLFLKLLEAVLKTGNRMNDGTFRGGAQAFKLDTLLKLSDVKGTDGKTTLLLFVVQEIIRSEGIRAVRVARENRSLSSIKSDDLLKEASSGADEHYHSLGLQVVSGLGDELENVKKAAALDADSLTGTVAKLGQALVKTRQFLNSNMKSLEEGSGFHQTLKSFVQNAEVDITWLLEEEKRIMGLVKSTGDYFHGNAGKDEGLRLFTIVRDFLIMVDKACREVREAPKKPAKVPKKEASSSDPRQPTTPSSSDPHQSPLDLRQRLFPAITDRRMENDSSDEESP